MGKAVGGVEWEGCECFCERTVQRGVVSMLLPLNYRSASDNTLRSFIGYSNANYALSEIRDPVRTIKRAAPLAMGAVTAVYLFINVAYFSVVSKNDILSSNRIVA